MKTSTVWISLFVSQFWMYDILGKISTGIWTTANTTYDTRQQVLIGFIATFNSLRHDADYPFIFGKKVGGALWIAMEAVNDDKSILPDHRLDVIVCDMEQIFKRGSLCLTLLWRQNVTAFFGPEVTCAHEGYVAAAWNLPLFSWSCGDAAASNKDIYSTFVRTLTSHTSIAMSVIALLHRYNWQRFTILAQKEDIRIKMAQAIRALAIKRNMHINHYEEWGTSAYLSAWVERDAGYNWTEIVTNTHIDTRVYVFLGTNEAMVEFMLELDKQGLIGNGEYMVIYVDAETDVYDPHDPFRYKISWLIPESETYELSLAIKRQLLVVTGRAPTNKTEYALFQDRIRNVTQLPPFNAVSLYPLVISREAAHLYDAVIIYAQALHRHLPNNGSVTDGAAIADIIRNKTWPSIQGYNITMDVNGTAKGNYTVMAVSLEHNYFVEAGIFQYADSFQIYLSHDNVSIPWVNGTPPRDEPPCGYRGEKCIVSHTYIKISVSTVGGLLLIAGIVATLYYRHWKYEQEVAGLSWKISLDDVKPDARSMGRRRSSSLHSKLSMGDQSEVVSVQSDRSHDTRVSRAQMYTTTGTYKGRIVALKVYDRKTINLNMEKKKQMKIMRDLRHDNLTAFLGVCIGLADFTIVTEYCAKGSLQDILVNDQLHLDDMFISSLCKDLIQGIMFIHQSQLICHGNLKSSNCIVSARWTLQVTDFGLLDVRATTYSPEDEYPYYRNLLWTAPELLRAKHTQSTRAADVYALGVIMHEIFYRMGPFNTWNIDSVDPKDLLAVCTVYTVHVPVNTEIVDKVRNATDQDNPHRPDISGDEVPDYVKKAMAICWAEDPTKRPTLATIWKYLKPMRRGMKSNIFDNMMAMMEKYQSGLELLVEERTMQLVEEKAKTENLLYRMLPRSVADELKKGQSIAPESFQCVTIYFSDICGFTHLSASSSPMQVVDLLNDLYTMFDSTIANYDVYKVETIGDAYMVVSGLPLPNGDNHAGEIASMSLDLLFHIGTFQIKHRPDETLKLRIGIHSANVFSTVYSTLDRDGLLYLSIDLQWIITNPPCNFDVLPAGSLPCVKV